MVAPRRASGYHPLVWALWVDLDALWRRLGPYSDPRARLVESVARWVRLTGKHQVPAGEWWAATLRALLAVSVLVDVPAPEQARLARWLEAARELGPIPFGRVDLGPSEG